MAEIPRPRGEAPAAIVARKLRRGSGGVELDALRGLYRRRDLDGGGATCTACPAGSTPTRAPGSCAWVPGGKLFLDPDRQLRSVRRGHVSESDGADELQELYCGTVPGCDGADELQELYCGTVPGSTCRRLANGQELCPMRRRRVPGSGWADELRGLCCGKVPGSDGADELVLLTTAKATTCDLCAAGEFQALTGQTSCEDCAAGKYQDLTGQTSCKNCDAGSISTTAKATTCDLCAAGEGSGWADGCRIVLRAVPGSTRRAARM